MRIEGNIFSVTENDRKLAGEMIANVDKLVDKLKVVNKHFDETNSQLDLVYIVNSCTHYSAFLNVDNTSGYWQLDEDSDTFDLYIRFSHNIFKHVNEIADQIIDGSLDYDQLKFLIDNYSTTVILGWLEDRGHIKLLVN